MYSILDQNKLLFLGRFQTCFRTPEKLKTGHSGTLNSAKLFSAEFVKFVGKSHSGHF